MTRQERQVFLNPEVQVRLAGADPLHLCREAAERLGGRKKHQTQNGPGQMPGAFRMPLRLRFFRRHCNTAVFSVKVGLCPDERQLPGRVFGRKAGNRDVP